MVPAVDVTSIYSFGVVPFLLLTLLLSVIIIFYFALKKEGSEIKVSRFEAGNVPKYEARVRYGMQYLGFFIIFASFEPIVLLLLFLSPASSFYAGNVFYFVLFTLILTIPVLLAAIKVSERIEEWMWE